MTTEEDLDEDVIQDYRLLHVGANQSADFISGTSDGTFQLFFYTFDDAKKHSVALTTHFVLIISHDL